MRRFLQLRLASHGLQVAVGCLLGGCHLDRAARVCTCCGRNTIGNELHRILECFTIYATVFSRQHGTASGMHDSLQILSHAVTMCTE